MNPYQYYIINRKGYCLRLNANKCGKNAEAGKSTFCNHYRKDWVRQKLSIDAKFRREF